MPKNIFIKNEEKKKMDLNSKKLMYLSIMEDKLRQITDIIDRGKNYVRIEKKEDIENMKNEFKKHIEELHLYYAIFINISKIKRYEESSGAMLRDIDEKKMALEHVILMNLIVLD